MKLDYRLQTIIFVEQSLIKLVIRSGGAGEFNPHAPTDPCVNLSIHTAPLIQLMAFTTATLLYAQVPPISG
jgi:hypothetical protein